MTPEDQTRLISSLRSELTNAYHDKRVAEGKFAAAFAILRAISDPAKLQQLIKQAEPNSSPHDIYKMSNDVNFIRTFVSRVADTIGGTE